MRLRALTVVFATVVCSAVVATWLVPPSLGRVIVIGVINLIFVTAYYAFSGLSGVLSFGHMAFAAVGGYTAGLAAMPSAQKIHLLRLPDALSGFEAGPVVAVVLGGLFAGLFAAMVSIPLSRISGLAAGLASAALLLVIHDISRNWDAVTRGSRGLSPLPTSTSLGSSVAWLVLAVVVVTAYERSSSGRRLVATRTDLVAAAAVGINYRLERWLSLVLSASLTGVAGALFVLFLGAVTPDVFFLNYTFLIIVMVIVGGLYSLPASILGGVTITILSEVLRRAEQGLSLGSLVLPARPGIGRIGLGVLLLVVLIWRPQGLAAGFGNLKGRTRSSLADADLEGVIADHSEHPGQALSTDPR